MALPPPGKSWGARPEITLVAPTVPARRKSPPLPPSSPHPQVPCKALPSCATLGKDPAGLSLLAALLPDLFQFKDCVGADGTVRGQAWVHRNHRDNSGQGQREEGGWRVRNPVVHIWHSMVYVPEGPSCPGSGGGKVRGLASSQAYRIGPVGEERGKEKIWRYIGNGGDRAPLCPPSWPPAGVGQVGALTVRAQVFPRDGHMRGSGNVPRAACEEWDTHRG